MSIASQTSFSHNNIAGHVDATSLSCGHHRGVLRFVHRPSDMLLSPSSSSRLLPIALLSVFLTSVTPSQTLIPAFPEGCPYIAENCTRLELLPVQRTDSCHQNIAAGFAQEIAAADDAQVCHCCIAFLRHCSECQPLKSPVTVSKTSWSTLCCRVLTWSFMVRPTQSLSRYFLLDSALEVSKALDWLTDSTSASVQHDTLAGAPARAGSFESVPCSSCQPHTIHTLCW